MLYADEILMQVEKPGRYIGREINAVGKNPKDVSVRFAFCFPDTYEVGMSHLGLQILYYFFNRRADVYCERVFAPWFDLEKLMREKGLPLVTLESYDPVSVFDFVGFTLQYEMSYTNILNMLDLAGIPLLAKDRGEDFPILCAGGPCAYNPEPLADFFDFFYMGEGEVCYDRIFDMYIANQKEGGGKAKFLEMLLEVEGIYVPRFYDVEYFEDGRIKAFVPNHPKAPAVIKKVICKNLDETFFPEKQLVPLIETVHDRVTLEVFRGCIRGCRFCQAGYVYRPVREKKPESLIRQAEGLVEHSGHEEISLVSLSTGDYSGFHELANGLLDCFAGQPVNISLPSLRIDAFNLELMNKVQEVRKSSLTFAPEAGTQRLRDVINKNLTEDEILAGCKLAFSGGWERVKLYFMIGLPTETEEDFLGIASLGEKILDQYYTLPREERKRPPSINMSASCFVPKPFTPFQWEAQNQIEVFEDKQALVRKAIHKRQIRFNYHGAHLSVLEGAMARGDRRVAKVILNAWRSGARFDGWSEHFDYEVWKRAFDEAGLSMDFYAFRQREYDEILPWDHIDVGVSKGFLIKEMEKAKQAVTTPDCRSQCAACGAACFGEGVCFENQV